MSLGYLPGERRIVRNGAATFLPLRREHGRARCTPTVRRRVEGLLYRVTPTDLCALDRHEGYPFAYERIVKLVTDERGRRRQAQVYRQPAETFEPWLPQPDYFRVLWHAYDRLGFDVAPLATAVGVEP